MEESNCIIKTYCPFHRKEEYDKKELNFYNDYCLKGGVGCGMKRNHDISERVKRILESKK